VRGRAFSPASATATMMRNSARFICHFMQHARARIGDNLLPCDPCDELCWNLQLSWQLSCQSNIFMVLNTTPFSIGIPDRQDAAETAGLTYADAAPRKPITGIPDGSPCAPSGHTTAARREHELCGVTPRIWERTAGTSVPWRPDHSQAPRPRP
jgi:hypothetical protein